MAPFVHLIPKQDIAPLLTYTSVSPNTDDLELVSARSKAVALQRIQNTEGHQDLLKTIVDDLHHFDMESLARLRFPHPTALTRYRPKNKHRKVDLQKESKKTTVPNVTTVVGDVESHIRLLGGICAAQLELPQLLLPVGEGHSGSRLSVRKSYPIVETEEMKAHHQRYARKFEAELERAGITVVREKRPSRSGEDEVDSAADGPFLQPLPRKKRRVEDKTADVLIEEELADLSEVLDTCDSTESKTDARVSACLQDIYTKLNFESNINKINISLLLKIEEQTFNFLCLSSEADWKSLEHLRDPRAVKSLLNLSKDYFTAAKIIALILNSDRQEKQLYIYDYLALVINFIATFCEQGLIPLAKVSVLNAIIVNSFRGAFAALCNEIEHAVDLLKCHASKRQVNEDLLTKLEYTSMTLIFSETNPRDKTSVIGVHQMELLKMAFSNLCVTIFKKNPTQRNFILSELLSNAYKIPLLKSSARQFKTSRGTAIHLLTSTLLNLLQSFAFEVSSKISLNAILSNDEQLDSSEKKEIMESAQIAYEDGEKFATEVSQYIVSYVTTNPTQANKQSLEVFITDILNILLFPEWPGAEMLLLGILRSLLTTIRAENGQDNFFLDMAGVIGVHLLIMRNNNPCALTWEFGHETPKDRDSDLFHTVCNVVEFVQIQGKKAGFYDDALKCLVIKYFHYLSPQLGSDRNSELNVLESVRSSDINEFSSLQANKIFDLLIATLLNWKAELPNSNSSNTFDKITLSYYRSIASNSIQFGIDSFLSTVVKCLDSNKATIKSRALKVLSNVVNKDSKVMLLPSIRDCISRRLLDNSSSVREAVIDLISKYIYTSAGVVDQFYRPMCGLLSDESTQVRRRVLKLCKEMYLSSVVRSTRSHIAIEMLKRCNDKDEGISQLASDTLADLWFTNHKNDITSSESLRVSEVMMDVVCKEEGLFEQLITDSIEKENSVPFQSIMKSHVTNILDFVVECQDTQFQLQVEKAMKLVACFAKCKHDLISQDILSSIRPYLMDESLAKGTVGYYSIIILKLSLMEMKSVRPELLESIQMHLMKNLSKYSQSELIHVMPCLWRLCKETKTTEKLANATLSCIQISGDYITEYKAMGHFEKQRNLQKVITLMSFLGTECDLDKHRDLFSKGKIGLQENETVTSLLTRIVMIFCSSKVDEQTYTVAITALMRFCIHNPKMFSLPIVAKTVAKAFQKENARAILSITDAVQRLIQWQDGEEDEAYQYSISSVQNSHLRESICARFVQRHVQDVLDTCVHCETKYQLGFFSFLQSMLKGGFTNPKTCIPTIIALGASQSKKIREKSFELSLELFTKHESLVETSYTEGIKLAALMTASKPEADLVTMGYFGKLYGMACQSISARKKLLNSIVKVTSINFKANTDALTQLDQVKFVAPRLTQIRYATIEEVCFIIYNLDQTICIAGMNYVDKLGNVDDSEPIEELEYLLYHCQSLILIMLLRDYLATCYSITSVHMDNYRPSRANQSLRLPPRIVTQLPFDVDIAQLSIEEPLQVTEIIRVINTTKKLMHKYA